MKDFSNFLFRELLPAIAFAVVVGIVAATWVGAYGVRTNLDANGNIARTR